MSIMLGYEWRYGRVYVGYFGWRRIPRSGFSLGCSNIISGLMHTDVTLPLTRALLRSWGYLSERERHETISDSKFVCSPKSVVDKVTCILPPCIPFPLAYLGDKEPFTKRKKRRKKDEVT